MDRLMAWVAAHNPEDPHDERATTLVHGDYRMDNTILHVEQPRVLAVIDWELSTLGHPLCDLAYYLMMYEFPHDDPVFPGLAGADLAGLAIPDVDEHLALYVRETAFLCRPVSVAS